MAAARWPGALVAADSTADELDRAAQAEQVLTPRNAPPVWTGTASPSPSPRAATAGRSGPAPRWASSRTTPGSSGAPCWTPTASERSGESGRTAAGLAVIGDQPHPVDHVVGPRRVLDAPRKEWSAPAVRGGHTMTRSSGSSPRALASARKASVQPRGCCPHGTREAFVCARGLRCPVPTVSEASAGGRGRHQARRPRSTGWSTHAAPTVTRHEGALRPRRDGALVHTDGERPDGRLSGRRPSASPPPGDADSLAQRL